MLMLRNPNHEKKKWKNGLKYIDRLFKNSLTLYNNVTYSIVHYTDNSLCSLNWIAIGP